MNSENLILRTATHSPLTTKGTYLDVSDFDNNNINIYEDFVSLATSEEIADYNVGTTYDNTLVKYCTYNGRTYKYINASATTGNLPTNTSYFIEIFPTELAHQKNKDTILDEGGTNEVSASEIRSFIDAGLTSTTNLSISGHTANSLVINSSTGTDVTLPQATNYASGLLTATNKVKLDNLSGINSGDQTLASLNAEDVDNKATDFSVINNVKYPTTEAVDAYLSTQVPTLVDTALTNSDVIPYKTILFAISQGGTSAPTIDFSYTNEVTQTFTFSRTAVGTYRVTASSALFTANKTFSTLGGGGNPYALYGVYRLSDTILELVTLDVSTSAGIDNALGETILEIKVIK